MRFKRAVGIDLGTTNSAISMMAPSGHDIWMSTDEMRRRTIPSVVGWDPAAEEFVTGWEGWNRRMLEPRPIQSVKRKMGQSRRLVVGPHELLPEEVSAKILEALVQPASEQFQAALLQSAEQDLDFAVTEAVITVPAYFDANQIAATQRAGELAGLDVIGLVQEPTAAAMYHGWKRGVGDANFLVFDLGGGTFDVSVIRSFHGEYQVLGIDGDNVLGGDDFDRRLAEYFRARLVEQGYALDLDIANSDDDARRFLQLERLAREAKEALSSTEVHYVGRRDIFEDHDGASVTLDFEVSRETFEELIEDFIDHALECCHRALAQSTDAAGVGAAGIDHVLLVGGSTRVPLVRRRVEETFGGGPIEVWGDEPDTCVSRGAAIHAATLGGAAWELPSGASFRVTAPLYSSGETGRIVGRLGGVEPGPIESVAVFNAAGDVLTVARPERQDDELFCAIEEIPLQHTGANRVRLEFCDADGEAVEAFELPMFRGGDDEPRPTGSALSNPTVLAKDIYLEVLRDGASGRQILLSRGSGLPARETFRFYTTDQSGAVVLRLFQNRFPIRTIHLAIPEETEVGTPVDLDLDVDEAMNIVAAGQVVGQKFWAQIESPPEREEKDWQTIELLLERADEVERVMWGYEVRHFRREVGPLLAGIRETARTDPDKLQVLARRLEDLLDDYSTPDAELTPGWSRFATLLDAIKRNVYMGNSNKQLGLSTDEWVERLKNIEETGQAAFDARDADAWSQTFNQVQAIWESLAQEEYRFRSSDPEEHLARLANSLGREIEQLRLLFSEFPYAANPETKSLQQREIGRLRRKLDERVARPLSSLDIDELPPSRAKPELDRLHEAANHIRREFDKVPTIGLVSRS